MDDKREFVCGYDIKPLFHNHEECKTKLYTVDRRKSCSDPVEKVYYQYAIKEGCTKTPLGICAFCAAQLSTSQIQKLKTLINQGDKVLPNCGKQACLKMNPKSNYDNGWTVQKKQVRKRKAAQDARKEKDAEKAKKNKKSSTVRHQENVKLEKKASLHQKRRDRSSIKATCKTCSKC